MNTEEKNKEIDINEVAITLEVDSEVIAKVRSGEITHILMDISEDNQNLVLETIDGNLILVTDEMPTTFHGCYLYNNGEFPKKSGTVLLIHFNPFSREPATTVGSLF